MRENFGPARKHRDVVELETIDEASQEGCLLLGRLEEGDVNLRPDDGDYGTREPGATSHVEHRGRRAQYLALAQGSTQGYGLEDVAANYHFGVRISDEAGTARPLPEKGQISLEPAEL
jgi:hypothetical protein